MKIFDLTYNFFLFWDPIKRKYVRIKNDEEKRTTSTTMGVHSIVQSVVCGIFTVLALFCLYLCIDNFTNGGSMPILTIIGGAAAGIAAILLFVQGIIGGLIYMVCQFKLNKRAVRWVALAVWIAVIVAIIIFTILTFPKM